MRRLMTVATISVWFLAATFSYHCIPYVVPCETPGATDVAATRA